MQVTLVWRPRQALAVLGVLSLVLALLALTPAAGADAAQPELRRLAGADRFGTAAAVAAAEFDASTSDVIIAAGYRFPDSLAAGGLAGRLDAPILLVNEVRDVPTEATLAALEALQPDRLHIAGGPAAVSSALETALARAGTWSVSRFDGRDRYDTAARMAGRFPAQDVDTVIVATGGVAADSLAVGPLAYHAGYPILLTKVDALPDSTAALLGELEPSTVLVLGGERAVSAGVQRAIEQRTGATVVRLAGATRFETAVSIADHAAAHFPEFAGRAAVGVATGYGPPGVGAGGGHVPADALTGAPHGGLRHAPLLPINDVRGEVPDAICGFLTAHRDSIADVTVFGGTQAVSPAVADRLAACAAGAAGSDPAPSGNESLVVTPDDTQLVDGSGGAAVEYSAVGLEPGAEYRIALFPCGNPDEDATVKVGADRYPNRAGASPRGTFTFRDQDLDDVADNAGSTQNGAARILAVASTTVNATQASGTADAGGRLTFRIGGGAGTYDCAVPVVWRDASAGAAGALDLVATTTNSWNRPAEAFGVGGALVLHGGEAATGATVAGDVLFRNDAERLAVLGDGPLLRWGRGGDSYAYGAYSSGALERTAFEQVLSIGDRLAVAGTYSRGGGNQIEITRDRGLNVVRSVQASAGAGAGDVRVSWDYANPPGANYRQFRVHMLEASDLSPVSTKTTGAVQTLNPFDAPKQLDWGGVAPGSYVLRVEGIAGQDPALIGAADSSLLSGVVTVDPAPGSPDPSPPAPLIVRQEVVDDWNPTGILGKSDEVEIAFDQKMTHLEGNTVYFRWSDGQGVYQVSCHPGGQAFCTWEEDSETSDRLRLKLTEAPALVSETGSGLDISGNDALMTVVSTAVRSAEGAAVDLDNSPDRRLNVAPPE
jgi:putative cell wall-binding protein